MQEFIRLSQALVKNEIIGWFKILELIFSKEKKMQQTVLINIEVKVEEEILLQKINLLSWSDQFFFSSGSNQLQDSL